MNAIAPAQLQAAPSATRLRAYGASAAWALALHDLTMFVGAALGAEALVMRTLSPHVLIGQFYAASVIFVALWMGLF